MNSETAPTETAGSVESRAEQRRAFGAKLKAAREAQGLTVTALGQTTRITIAFLEVLEAGAFDRLPGAVFGRGFVRSIARATGQDADQLVKEFESLWEREPPKSVLKVEIKNKPVVGRLEALKSVFTLAGAPLGVLRRGLAWKPLWPLAALSAIGYFAATAPTVRTFLKERLKDSSAASVAPAKTLDLSASERSEGSQPEAVAAETAPQAPADATPELVAKPEAAPATSQPSAAANPKSGSAMQPAAASSEQVLEMTVSESVRIKLDVDGGDTVTKELAPDTYRFTFKAKADVMIYDAGAVKMSFNGRPLGSLGTKGRVRRLSFDATSPTPNEL